MGRASDAPVVASAGTQAEPRTPASWLLFADRSQTAAPLPVGSDPRSVRRTEPFHKAPLPSSPALGRYAKGLPCCRNFTPAQPDRPAASMRDFCSGAYTLGLFHGLSRRFWFAHRREQHDLQKVVDAHVARVDAVIKGNAHEAEQATDALMDHLEEFARATLNGPSAYGL